MKTTPMLLGFLLLLVCTGCEEEVQDLSGFGEVADESRTTSPAPACLLEAAELRRRRQAHRRRLLACREGNVPREGAPRTGWIRSCAAEERALELVERRLREISRSCTERS